MVFPSIYVVETGFPLGLVYRITIVIIRLNRITQSINVYEIIEIEFRRQVLGQSNYNNNYTIR